MRRCSRSIAVLWSLAALKAFAWVQLSPVSFQRPISSLNCARARSSEALREDDKLDLKLLVIDHYDSFTYNLVDLLAQLCISPPLVLAADCASSWEELLRDHNLTELDGIVLSPGPGNPETAGALSSDIVRQCCDLPILGVCLGHQILGHVYNGSTVDQAPVPIHGQVRRVCRLTEDDDPLWKGLSEEISVTRYHSLQVLLASDSVLEPTAVSPDDDVLMGMRHAEYPHYGVQFHPESIGTIEGKHLLANFCEICQTYQRRRDRGSRAPVALNVDARQLGSVEDHSPTSCPYEVYIHKVSKSTMRPTDVMRSFLADNDYSFWLDEALSDGRTPAVSILGASTRRVEYWGKDKHIDRQGLYRYDGSFLNLESNVDILSYLQEEHGQATDAVTFVEFTKGDDDNNNVRLQRHTEDELQSMLPFDYRGGHVGYLGYEVRHDTARYLEKEEHGHHQDEFDTTHSSPKTLSNSHVPTAAFMWADRSYVYDHQSGDWYLVAVVAIDETTDSMMDWMLSAAKAMEQPNGVNGYTKKTRLTPSHPQMTMFTPNRSRETYNRNFDNCLEQIRLGESYELCLTSQIEATVKAPGSSPLDLYDALRQRNPAPFSAFFNWNGMGATETESEAALAICCSSMERFVSVKPKKSPDDNIIPNAFELAVEAKPIKGTCARIIPANGIRRTESERGEDVERAKLLESSVKDRAENLMIVDLLRNDLSRVCKTGSVHVAKLMDIESYATVHQMVSTIRGTLDSTSVDVLKACFPGGSMTGAPKLRTMELLNEMEEGVARGPYSGCLGYISLNGSMDTNIIIRTAVLTPSDESDTWHVSIGAGGAITALSEKEDEYEELMLKASAVMGAVRDWASAPLCSPSSVDMICEMGTVRKMI